MTTVTYLNINFSGIMYVRAAFALLNPIIFARTFGAHILHVRMLKMYSLAPLAMAYDFTVCGCVLLENSSYCLCWKVLKDIIESFSNNRHFYVITVYFEITRLFRQFFSAISISTMNRI